MTGAERQIAAMTGRAPQRIVLFRALYLGDMLLAVPAMRSIRAGFPRAEITLIGLPWAEAFVERFVDYVDRFLPFPGCPGIDEVEHDPQRTRSFITGQRAYGYDLAVQMHGSGRTSNSFVLDFGATVTAGHYEGHRPGGLDIAAPWPDGIHEIERNLRLAGLLGCDARDTRLEFPLSDADRREAAELLVRVSSKEGDPQESWLGTSSSTRSPRPAARGPLVGIHPGAKFPAKRWMPERFAAVGDALAQRHGARVLLTGGPGEEEVVAGVADGMQFRPVVLSGRTSIGGLAALIDELDLFISNDTGPAHIAAALGTPSIVIFGPADARRWAPLDSARHRVVRRGVSCSPCGYEVCPIDHRCLDWIAPDDVVTAATELLNRRFGVCAA